LALSGRSGSAGGATTRTEVTGSLDDDVTGPPSRVSSAIPESSASVEIVGDVATAA
jgi:hypothetical protein